MDSFWTHCLRHFQSAIPAQQFKTWIQPLNAELDGNTVHIAAPNRFVLEWVRDKYLGDIRRLSSEYLDKNVHISMTLATRQAQPPSPTAQSPTTPAKPRDQEKSRLNPLFTFDTFVTGKANQLARAAALQVTEHLGSAYNPLCVYGGVGLGKTHLIQAIGNAVRDRQPDAKIRYIHAEQYVSDVVRAYQQIGRAHV